MATRVGDIFVNLKLDRSDYDKGLRSMGASAGKFSASIGKKIAVGLAGIGFGKFIKDATKAGASLNAMGTIIDASLPHMTEQVDEFAKSAGHAFGLSETQAKGFVGKFASMASAMGYTEDEAYKMSTALTGLAGDVASYYHISQDEAFAKLGAVFTGETESLKQLGVIMTQSALDAFALEQGYGRVTSQMSELEKTTLRYNFVLDRLKLASGDFAKYANTWSGSIATIKLNWSNFMAVMGQGIINILLPLLQLIARISNALSALASRFLGWTKSLRGIKTSVQGAFGKKTQKDLKTANTGIGNVGSGLGGAGKSAKGAKKAVQALKRELLGFDKITKLTGENGTTSGGTGTGGAGGAGGGGLGDLGLADYDMSGTAENYVDGFVEKLKEAWAKKDFTEIGAIVAEKINGALGSINWSKIKTTSEGIAKSIGTFINGFTENFDWKLLAQTISKGIETAIDTVSTLIETINWGAIGSAIVKFITGIDWKGLFNSGARLAKAIAEALGEAIGGAVAELGKTISQYVSEKGFSGIAKDIATSLAKGFVNILTGKWIYDYFVKPFWDGFTSGFKGKEGESAGATIISNLKTGLDNNWNTIKTWFANLPAKIASAIGTISVDVVAVMTTLKDALKSKSIDVVARFTEWVKGTKFGNIIDGLTAFFSKKDSAKGLLSGAWGSFTAWFEKKANKNGILSGNWGSFTAWFEKKTNKNGLLNGNWGSFTAWFEKKSNKKGLLDGSWGSFIAPFTGKKAEKNKGSEWWKGDWGAFSARFYGKDAKKNKGSEWWKGGWGAFTARFYGKKAEKNKGVKWWTGAWGAFTAVFTGKTASGGKNKKKASGGVYKNGRWTPIQHYATGGTPSSGQMFIARERGAELVGQLNGHTAVMNNDQIVASVSSGVARAMSGIKFEAKAPALASYSTGKAQAQQTQDNRQILAVLQALLTAVNALDLDVVLDGESIKRNTVSRINQHTRSTGQLELII